MTPKNRFTVCLIALILLLGTIVPSVLAAGIPGFHEIVKAPMNSYYTPLTLAGYDGTVYAFSGPDGITRFRVYGTLNKVTGYYPVAVKAVPLTSPEGNQAVPDDNGALDVDTFEVTLIGTQPVKDGAKAMGAAKLTTGAAELPDGWKNARTRGLVYIENLFGEKEYRAYASFDNEHYLFFPTKNSKPAAGSLASVVEDMNARKRLEGERVYRVPAELKNGYQTLVYIKLPTGEMAMVPTRYPAINREVVANGVVGFIPVELTSPQAAAATSVIISTPAPTPDPAPPAPVLDTTLKFGSVGDAVVRLQNRLNALGYNSGAADGKFGRKTEAAVKAFQKANNLREDGIAGASTLAKLYSNSAIPFSVVNPGPVATASAILTGPTPPPSYSFKDHINLTLNVTATRITTRDSITLTGKYAYDGTNPYDANPLNPSKPMTLDATLALMTQDMKFVQGKEVHGRDNPMTITYSNIPAGTYQAWYHVAGGEYENVYKEITIVVEGVNAVITTEFYNERSTIPFTTEHRANATMLTTDAVKVIQKGYNGELTKVYKITYSDGVETSREFVQEHASSAMIPEIIEYGTRVADGSTTKTETVTQPIAITTERRANANMLTTDPEKVVQAGSAGVKTIVYLVTLKDGVETGRTVQGETATTPMVPKIVEYGTKQPPVITSQDVVVNEDIPFTIERRANAEMLTTDAEKVAQTGVNGINAITYKVTYADGVETSRVKASEAVIQQPVNQIIEYGTKAPAATPLNIVVTHSPQAPQKGDRITVSWNITGGTGNYTLGITVYYEGVIAVHESTSNATGSISTIIGNAGKWEISYSVTDGVNEIGKTYEPFVLAETANPDYTYTYDGSFARSIYDTGKFAGEWNGTLAGSAASQAMSAAKRNALYHDGSDGWIESAAKFSSKPSASWAVDQLISHVSTSATAPYVGVGAVRVEKVSNGEVYYYVYVKTSQSQP